MPYTATKYIATRGFIKAKNGGIIDLLLQEHICILSALVLVLVFSLCDVTTVLYQKWLCLFVSLFTKEMCLSTHRYHPSQCSRSLHTASKEHRPPLPSPGSWWRDRPQQTLIHADTHLKRKTKGRRGKEQRERERGVSESFSCVRKGVTKRNTFPDHWVNLQKTSS